MPFKGHYIRAERGCLLFGVDVTLFRLQLLDVSSCHEHQTVMFPVIILQFWVLNVMSTTPFLSFLSLKKGTVLSLFGSICALLFTRSLNLSYHMRVGKVMCVLIHLQQ